MKFLITDGAPGFTGLVHTLQGELAAAGRGGTPIYIGEIGSAIGPGGKQTMSITQALYAGQVIGEMLNDGIARATWHVGYSACASPSEGGDFSPSLYGWQNYGEDGIFSDGANPALPWQECTAWDFVSHGDHIRDGIAFRPQR